MEDQATYDVANGRPIPLRWKDEYLEKRVHTNATANGPQDVPLTKERFCEILRGIVTTAGYSESLNIHKIRKYLGSVIKGRTVQAHISLKESILLITRTGKHGSALVCQIYGHKDAGTYPKDYILHCSSINAVSAVLYEEDQSSHIEYFQGFKRFYERWLPRELPAEVEENILLKPELVEIRNQVEELEALDGNKESIIAERLN